MGKVNIIVGDITKIPCDVIVNSLGVNTTDYGGICKSILKAANSTELEEVFKRSNDVYDVGEYFFTDGYDLPVRKICHLITPHHDQDPNQSILLYSIKNLLMSCRRLGYKKIAIPIIGVGANKYKKEEVLELLETLSGAITVFYPLEITIVCAEEPIRKENRARLSEVFVARGRRYHEDGVKVKFAKSSKLFKKYYEYNDEKVPFTKSFFEKPSTAFTTKGKMNTKGIDTIPTYINRYIDFKFDGDAEKKVKKNIHAYLGFGKNNPIDSGSNTFKKLKASAEKKTFYKLCLSVRMEYIEAEEFLKFFGLAFANPGINKADDIVRQLLHNHTYDIIEVNKKWVEAGLKPPLFS